MAARAPWPGRSAVDDERLQVTLNELAGAAPAVVSLFEQRSLAEQASGRLPWCAWTALRALDAGAEPRLAVERGVIVALIAATDPCAAAEELCAAGLGGAHVGPVGPAVGAVGGVTDGCAALAALDALVAWIEAPEAGLPLDPILEVLRRAGADVAPIEALRAGIGRESGVAAAFAADELRSVWSAALQEGLDGHGLPPDVTAGGHRVLRYLAGFGAFRSLVSPGLDRLVAASGADPLPEIEPAVARAVTFMGRDSSWRASWDERPTGLLEDTTELVAQWFPCGLILQALLEAGEPVEDRCRALLAELPRGPIRYYGDWVGIPPDSDDLGLFLALSARVGGVDPAHVAGWLSALPADEGVGERLPTWLPGPGVASPSDTRAIDWLGDDCVAVRLCLIHGLLRAGGERWRRRALSGLRACCEQRGDEGFLGLFHYGQPFAAVLFARAVEAAGLEHVSGLAEVATAVARRLARGQAPDGSWGSALDTAASLRALATLGPTQRGPLTRGLRWLLDEQHPDGGFDAAPLYVVPGMGRRQRSHGSRELTTALAVAALRRAQLALRAGPEAPRR